MSTPNTLPALLRRARAARGLSLNALARATEINVGTLHRLEQGVRRPTGRAQILAIAASLGLGQPAIDQLLHVAGLTCTTCHASEADHGQ